MPPSKVIDLESEDLQSQSGPEDDTFLAALDTFEVTLSPSRPVASTSQQTRSSQQARRPGAPLRASSVANMAPETRNKRSLKRMSNVSVIDLTGDTSLELVESPVAPKKMRSSGKGKEKAQPVLTLDDALDCPICMDIYVGPQLLSCGHTFCQGCITDWLLKKPGQCPTCSQKSDLPPYRNLVLEAVVEKYHDFKIESLVASGKANEASRQRAERTQQLNALEIARMAENQANKPAARPVSAGRRRGGGGGGGALFFAAMQ